MAVSRIARYLCDSCDELLVDMLACSVKVGCCGCWRTVTVHRQAGTRTVGYTAAAAAATECTIRHRLRGGRTDRQQRRIDSKYNGDVGYTRKLILRCHDVTSSFCVTS